MGFKSLMSIEKTAKTLKDQVCIFNCSYEVAWEQWIHPLIKEMFTFEEVMMYIDKEN